MRVDPTHPHQIAHRDYTVLVVHPDGQISGDDGCGLFDHDCRILSRYRLTVDGRVPDCIASATIDAQRWVGTLRLATGQPTPEGPMLPQDDLEIRLERRLGAGMVERIEIRNHSMAPRDGPWSWSWMPTSRTSRRSRAGGGDSRAPHGSGGTKATGSSAGNIAPSMRVGSTGVAPGSAS